MGPGLHECAGEPGREAGRDASRGRKGPVGLWVRKAAPRLEGGDVEHARGLLPSVEPGALVPLRRSVSFSSFRTGTGSSPAGTR